MVNFIDFTSHWVNYPHFFKGSQEFTFDKFVYVPSNTSFSGVYSLCLTILLHMKVASPNLVGAKHLLTWEYDTTLEMCHIYSQVIANIFCVEMMNIICFTKWSHSGKC